MKLHCVDFQTNNIFGTSFSVFLTLFGDKGSVFLAYMQGKIPKNLFLEFGYRESATAVWTFRLWIYDEAACGKELITFETFSDL